MTFKQGGERDVTHEEEDGHVTLEAEKEKQIGGGFLL